MLRNYKLNQPQQFVQSGRSKYPRPNPQMKFSKHPNPFKTFTIFVMLWGVLCTASPVAIAHSFNSDDSSLTLSLNASMGSSQNLKPYAPVQNKNNKPQSETEIREDHFSTCSSFLKFIPAAASITLISSPLIPL